MRAPVLALVAAALAGCGADAGRSTPPPDLAAPAPCASLLARCATTLAAARTAALCTGVTSCAGYDAVDYFMNGAELTCYYRNGVVVDAWSFDDIGPTCAGNGAHSACGDVVWSGSCGSDGGI